VGQKSPTQEKKGGGQRRKGRGKPENSAKTTSATHSSRHEERKNETPAFCSRLEMKRTEGRRTLSCGGGGGRNSRLGKTEDSVFWVEGPLGGEKDTNAFDQPNHGQTQRGNARTIFRRRGKECSNFVKKGGDRKGQGLKSAKRLNKNSKKGMGD